MKRFLLVVIVFTLCSIVEAQTAALQLNFGGGTAGTTTLDGLNITFTAGTPVLAGTFNLPSTFAVTDSNGALPLDLHTMNINNQTFIGEGDSITSGYGLNNPQTPYLVQLMAMPYWHNHATYYNYAVAGSLIADMQNRYTANVHPHRPTANGGDGGAKVTLNVLIGVNNLASGSSAASIVTALTTYVAGAQADGITVSVGCILPNWVSGAFYGSEASRQQVNYAIRTGSTGANLVWDATKVLGDPTDTNLYLEGLHPTYVGHIILANYLNSFYINGGGATMNVNNDVEGNMTLTGTLGAGTLIPARGNTKINVSGTLNMTSGTISAPSNTGTAAGWIGVQVSGTTYKLPVYQ